VALVILHGGVQKHFVHIFLENENALVVEIGVRLALGLLIWHR
jgi:hypothetical protein